MSSAGHFSSLIPFFFSLQHEQEIDRQQVRHKAFKVLTYDVVKSFYRLHARHIKHLGGFLWFMAVSGRRAEG